VIFLNRAGRTIVLELRSALFDHVQRLSLQFHSRRSTGDVLTRMTSDAKAVRDILTESLADLLSAVLFLVGMAGVLFWLDWKLAIVATASTPLLFVMLRRFSLQIREHSMAERAREGALASIAHETLGTMRLLRAFGQEQRAKERFHEHSVASLESGFAAARAQERFSWAADVVTAAATAAVLWFGVHRVVGGAMTVGTLVVFVSYTRSFFKPLRTAIKQGNKISRAAARIERVADLLEVEEGVRDLPGARPAPRLTGRIEFRGVWFEYERAKPVLRGVDLVVPAGRVTAVVGPSGAGKTTLAALVPRLYDPTRGVVAIDGHDVRDFTLTTLRTQVSMVLQESVLLSASLHENIAYGRPSASFDEIVAAAKAASAHDFITALPEGYDTIVGERGETLSGGQRQRIAIARAVIRGAPIVILDEPLAGLDAASADAVMDALDELIAGRTVLLITHSSELMGRADDLVMLEGGHVVDGSAAALRTTEREVGVRLDA
jgi:ABC-type multidrug transport system fused ATPase/permease subunit